MTFRWDQMSSQKDNTSTSADELRWARRNAARIGGQICHPRLAQPLQCTVRDTSSTGARLEMAHVIGGQISRDTAPENFTLVMPMDRLEVDCQVAWRRGNLIGVRYTSPTRRLEKKVVKREEARKPGASILSKIINP